MGVGVALNTMSVRYSFESAWKYIMDHYKLSFITHVCYNFDDIPRILCVSKLYVVHFFLLGRPRLFVVSFLIPVHCP